MTWTYVVTNTGNVPLANVTVTDDQAGVTPVYQGGDTNTNNLLDLTETWTYQATGTAVAGQYANIGTVTGFYPQGEEQVDDTDPSHYVGYVPTVDDRQSRSRRRRTAWTPTRLQGTAARGRFERDVDLCGHEHR